MTESEDLKRSECKLRYLRVLESKQKEIENKERRCQSLSSTLEEYRNKVAEIRAERDKLEEECRLKIEPEQLQLFTNIRKEAFIETVQSLELSGLTEKEVLSNLFFSALSQIAISSTLERPEYQDSEAEVFISGGELLLTLAGRLGCKMLSEDSTVTKRRYDLYQFSKLMDELVSQIIEVKQSQQFD